MKKHKPEWVRVTKEYVVKTFGQQGCKNCGGEGKIGDDQTGYVVCSCAALAFRREMISRGRTRIRTQRMGKRDATWIEMRESTLGVVEDEPSDGA